MRQYIIVIVADDGAIEECYASHGRNMSPMRRCLTGPTQSPLSLMNFLRGDCMYIIVIVADIGRAVCEL